jgi:putative nucleotidyltransferase-like protein
MRRSALSPEARLLYLAATIPPSDSAVRQALTTGVEWGDLLTLAQHERAASILSRSLARVGADTGDPAYQKLRRVAVGSAMHMLRLEQLLHETIAILAREKIDAILLKGAGLAYTAYVTFSDRPMGDLDLLVPSHQAKHAWSLLQTMGWGTEEKTPSARFSNHHHLPRLSREAGMFKLEIHDALLSDENPFRFSMECLWARSHQLRVQRQTIRVPHAIHQLWHASVHFAWSHRMAWGSWRTFRDIGAIIRTRGIDWAEFVAFARHTRAATCCFWTLKLARRLVGAEVPDSVLRLLRPPYPEFVVRQLERHLLAGLLPSRDGCPSIELARFLWELAIMPRWSGHGSSRPWHVLERWLRDVEPTTRESPAGKRVGDLIRRVSDGGGYLLRVSRLTLPVDFAAPTTPRH